MNTRYDELKTKSVGLAFILGPVLLFVAALVFAAGIGRNPNDIDSYVEGMIAFYGMIFFIPIWVKLAGVVGRCYPKYGITLAVLGLMSAAAGVMPMAGRVLQKTMIDEGINIEIWDLFDKPIMFPVVIIMPLFPIIGALLGIGLLKGRLLELRVGIGLILTAPMFILVQAGGSLVEVVWPLTTLLYVVVLAPLGWRLVTTGEIQATETTSEGVATATASS